MSWGCVVEKLCDQKACQVGPGGLFVPANKHTTRGSDPDKLWELSYAVVSGR